MILSQKNQLVCGAKGQQIRDGPEIDSERERLLSLELSKGDRDRNTLC